MRQGIFQVFLFFHCGGRGALFFHFPFFFPGAQWADSSLISRRTIVVEPLEDFSDMLLAMGAVKSVERRYFGNHDWCLQQQQQQQRKTFLRKIKFKFFRWQRCHQEVIARPCGSFRLDLSYARNFSVQLDIVQRAVLQLLNQGQTWYICSPLLLCLCLRSIKKRSTFIF